MTVHYVYGTKPKGWWFRLRCPFGYKHPVTWRCYVSWIGDKLSQFGPTERIGHIIVRAVERPLL